MGLTDDTKELIVKGSETLKRMELGCDHHRGTFYFTQSESNWVCHSNYVVSHSLNGLFKDLTELEDERIKSLFQKWGIYYRNTS